jgi:hypothetical protein
MVFEHALEMNEPAERPLPYRRNVNWHALAADEGRGNLPLGPAVPARRALEEFAGGGDGFSVGGEGKRIHRILEEQPRGVGPCPRRIERRKARLVEPVQRRRQQDAAAARRDGRAAELPDRHR